MTGDTGRLARIAAEHGTPVYVYDLAEVRRAHADLRRCLPRASRLLYSLKANPHPHIVRELVRAGADPEVSSSRELDVALSAGAAPRSCLYTGPAKTDAEIDHALAAGVRRFSVDSPTDLGRLGARARPLGIRAQAILRLNPRRYPGNAGLAMGGTHSPFGADVAWVRAEPERFRADGVDLVGYHVYIGTNSTEETQLAGWFELGLDAVGEAHRALGGDVRLIDLGGGFGSPFARNGSRPELTGLASLLDGLVSDRLAAGGLGDPVVAFESGRYLVGTAGSLVVGVQDVKSSHGTRYVVADGGINVLGGMQGLRRVPPLMAEALSPDPGPGPVAAPGDTAVLAGPLCTPLDVLNPRAAPAHVGPGDLLVVPNVGAYGLTASLLGFLSREAPVEVAVDGDRVVSALRLSLGYTEAVPRSARRPPADPPAVAVPDPAPPARPGSPLLPALSAARKEPSHGPDQ
ncbi:type III PLP-dependent enzyme [Streptomyces sp. NPDC021020]|uniref:type III PLP-dependent enzyme n=1 Tax=Streptomyces sp. NPDC021020 TaxID=3365109 RepID=UPI0037A2E5AD